MSLPSTDLRSVKRLIIRGDGSFNVDPKGDWVSARHFDEALGEIERLRFQLTDFHNVDDVVEIRRLREILRKAGVTGAPGPTGEWLPDDVGGDA